MIFKTIVCALLFWLYAISIALLDDIALKLSEFIRLGHGPGGARNLGRLADWAGGSPELSAIVCFIPMLLTQLASMLRRQPASTHSYLACVALGVVWVIQLLAVGVIMSMSYLMGMQYHGYLPLCCAAAFVVSFVGFEIASLRMAQRRI